jgi:cyanate permease
MYFRQVLHEEKSCASYLVGCPTLGVCAVVDPQGEPAAYIDQVAAQALSVIFVRETRGIALLEAGQVPQGSLQPSLSFRAVFSRVTWQDFAFFRLSQAGFVNNLNDVVSWGLLPLLAVQRGSTVQQAALLGGTYLAVWGASQLGTGPLSDRVGRQPLIAGGLWLQALGIALLGMLPDSRGWIVAVVLMGLGTGMAYPALLAAVSDRAHPSWRASALGVYRFWRDGGYAAGAVLAGLLSDSLGVPAAIIAIAAITGLSGTAVIGRRGATIPAPR